MLVSPRLAYSFESSTNPDNRISPSSPVTKYFYPFLINSSPTVPFPHDILLQHILLSFYFSFSSKLNLRKIHVEKSYKFQTYIMWEKLLEDGRKTKCCFSWKIFLQIYISLKKKNKFYYMIFFLLIYML